VQGFMIPEMGPRHHLCTAASSGPARVAYGSFATTPGIASTHAMSAARPIADLTPSPNGRSSGARAFSLVLVELGSVPKVVQFILHAPAYIPSA